MAIITRGSQRIDYGKRAGVFDNVDVGETPHSGFDMSYNNSFDAHFGLCYPTHVQEVIPSDRVSLDVSAVMNFAPLVNPIFADLEASFASFFVPYRIIWDDWKSFIHHTKNKAGQIPEYVPQLGPNTGAYIHSVATTYGSLLDFLGYGTPVTSRDFAESDGLLTNNYVRCSALPWRAYWRIIADWYQNIGVQDIETDPDYVAAYRTDGGLVGYEPNLSNVNLSHKPFELFTRLYNRDFLSTATYSAQQDTPVTVDTSAGSFNLSQFRVASALDRWARRQNLAGGRYNECIMAHFGVMPDDATVDKAQYLGSYRQKIDVSTTTQVSQTATTPLGTQAGKASSAGGNHMFDRVFTEHGIIITIMSLCVPAAYSQFRNRHLIRSKYTDFPWPEMSNIGDEEVLSIDVCSNPTVAGYYVDDDKYANDTVIGFNERYWYEKSRRDEVHGSMADASNQLFKYSAARAFDLSDFNAEDYNFDLGNGQSMDYVNFENRCFQTGTATPARINVRNSCYMVRPLTEFSTPLV